MNAAAAAQLPEAGPSTPRDDLTVEAGGLSFIARGAQLVDGQPRFDWVEFERSPGVVDVDRLYVESGRYFETSGAGRGKLPMLIGLRRAINEAISAALQAKAAA